MKIVIAGQGKSGTTALFYKLMEAYQSAPVTMLEPVAYTEQDSDRVLAKVLIDPPGRVDFDSFVGFERKILIVRDPRDNLISRLLYRPYNREDFVADERAVSTFIEAVRRKESDPGGHSLCELIRSFDALTGVDSLTRLQGHAEAGLAFSQQHPDYYVFQYEDMIDGELSGLSDYIGVPLAPGETAVASEHQRVKRSLSYGYWREWFTDEDVSAFQPHFSNYIEEFGYAADWELKPGSALDPALGSEYVLRVVNERRQQLALPALGN